MQISTINNYSIQSNQRQQQNPNFGKLIIDKSVPTELIKPIAKNSEIQKMVEMFHGIGVDIMTRVEDTYLNIPNYSDRYAKWIGKDLKFIPNALNIKVNQPVLCIKGFEPTNYLSSADIRAGFTPDGYFLKNIEEINEGTAEYTFNKFQADTKEATKLEKARLTAEAKATIEINEAAKKAKELQEKMDRENALAEVEALNKSLEPKKSFWKRLFNL